MGVEFMIGFIPNPRPDELIFSVLARYADRLRFPSHRSLLRELFASNRVSTLIDFPCRLDRIANAFPPGSSLNADELIDNQTMLPAHAAFLPAKRVDNLRDAMKRAGGHPIHLLVGHASCRVPVPRYLRYCPLCVVQSDNDFAEVWWHRLHQFPGVIVCPEHACFLEESTVDRLHRDTSNAFPSARTSIATKPPRLLRPQNQFHQMLIRIAENVAWLLAQPAAGGSSESIRFAFISLLRERGFTTCNGRLYRDRLLEVFGAKYSRDYLMSLGSPLETDGEVPWLVRLLHRSRRVQHPIRQILLIDFLGYTTKSFFTDVVGQPKPYRPFGAGPWCCLNPVCNRRRTACIKRMLIRHSFEHKQAIGIFFCPVCGFTYRKLVSEASTDRKRVLDFGPVWRSALKELWSNPRRTIREMEEMLEADSLTIKRHAIKLGCPYPRTLPRR